MNIYCVETGRLSIEGHAFQIVQFDIKQHEPSRLPADHAVLARDCRVLTLRGANESEVVRAMMLEAMKYRLLIEPTPQMEYVPSIDISLSEEDIAQAQYERAIYLDYEIDYALAHDIAERWQILDLLAELADLKTRASQALERMGIAAKK